jgi:exonuclease SbcD
VEGRTDIRLGDAAVHGLANFTKQGGIRPLDDMSPDPAARFNIAVLHASMEIEGKCSPNDYLVGLDTVATCGMDYLALGHWHKPGEFSDGEVKAWYCGAPEVTKYDEAGAAGNVLMVDLSDGGITVSPVPVNKYQWVDRAIDVSTCPPGPALEAEIASLAGDSVIMRLRLNGPLEKGEEVDADGLKEQFEDDFFSLEIDDAKVTYPTTYAEGVFPDETIGAFFVGRMKAKIAEADDESEKAVLEKALARGARYIVEGEV